jgi:hypothetical protein
MMELNSMQWHVLDATADDWESLAQIVPHVNAWHGKTEPDAIARVIAELVSSGLLEEAEGRTVIASQLVEHPSRLWFSMTKSGRELWEHAGQRFRNE